MGFWGVVLLKKEMGAKNGGKKRKRKEWNCPKTLSLNMKQYPEKGCKVLKGVPELKKQRPKLLKVTKIFKKLIINPGKENPFNHDTGNQLSSPLTKNVTPIRNKRKKERV